MIAAPPHQFADPARGPVAPQILLLGATFVLVAMITGSGYALLAGRVGASLRLDPALARGERYLSGAVYLGLGAPSLLAGGGLTSGPRP